MSILHSSFKSFCKSLWICYFEMEARSFKKKYIFAFHDLSNLWLMTESISKKSTPQYFHMWRIRLHPSLGRVKRIKSWNNRTSVENFCKIVTIQEEVKVTWNQLFLTIKITQMDSSLPILMLFDPMKRATLNYLHLNLF